ncbi:MAG: DNA-3-methyladenine glycosylase 2 family protein [Ruminococcaceae bacterium]|nr:DNA-3-methyladenine glycosylase 2 family protein [Oscillospiraceae bacterium]
MFKTEFKNNNVYVSGVQNFSLPQTLDCGQAFRWSEKENGIWCGVAFNKYLELEIDKNDVIILHNTCLEDFESIWCNYFDFNRDYDEIIREISGNEILKNAASFGKGIRVLNQEPWETLCSFIISQNNNIKRIKGIISRLCENFGENMGTYFTFPSAEKIASLSLEDLSVLRSGFRAKYILDAAIKVSNGEIDLNNLKNLSTDEARQELMKIKGVGPKVAECALLFSHQHIAAFPKDVWIKRAMQVLFDGELPKEAVPYAGIVQQYIFFYARETKLNI